MSVPSRAGRHDRPLGPVLLEDLPAGPRRPEHLVVVLVGEPGCSGMRPITSALMPGSAAIFRRSIAAVGASPITSTRSVGVVRTARKRASGSGPRSARP